MSLIYLTESKAFIKVAESDTHPKTVNDYGLHLITVGIPY
jgi:hypothetical protein